MQKIIKIVVVIVFLTGGIFAYATSYAEISTERNLTKIENSSSRNLYVNNCARCHGANGKSDTELGKLYGATDLTSRKVQKMGRKRMARIIKNGASGMPGFGKKLNDKEINSVVNYVYSF